MYPTVNFDSSPEVAGFVEATFGSLYPGASPAGLRRLFGDVEALFLGRNPAYAAIDLKYHNFRHTLMATACLGGRWYR